MRKNEKTKEMCLVLTHNQGVPGSSPGGPTESKRETLVDCNLQGFIILSINLFLSIFVSFLI